jgi:hypothetical protein
MTPRAIARSSSVSHAASLRWNRTIAVGPPRTRSVNSGAICTGHHIGRTSGGGRHISPPLAEQQACPGVPNR